MHWPSERADGVSIQVTRRYEILQVCIVPVILGLQTVTKEQIMMDVNEGGNDECLIIRRPKISKIPLSMATFAFDLTSVNLLIDKDSIDCDGTQFVDYMEDKSIGASIAIHSSSTVVDHSGI